MLTHLEDSFQRDINRIRDHITEMAGCAGAALKDSIKALVENDRKLAYAVILRDQYIDEKEKEIDRLCLEFIVRQQPVAMPLRFAYSTIKINLEIERVGDYAESIARHILKFREILSKEILDGVVELAELSTTVFCEATQAFVNQDPELAKKNVGINETVDAMRAQLNSNLVTMFREKALTFEQLDPLLTIIRRFERVADQARNICMESLYMCTGEYAKHPGAEAIRVLFIDDNNSCRSQIAEAVALSLSLPKFVFSSAGLEPKPIDHMTLDFMRTKGIDLSRTAPRAIHQVPNLDHYQVIVALSKDVHAAFPQRPRKVVFLDWLVNDPSQAKGTDAEIRGIYEEVYTYIQSQVNDLIEAITGSDKYSERKHS